MGSICSVLEASGAIWRHFVASWGRLKRLGAICSGSAPTWRHLQRSGAISGALWSHLERSRSHLEWLSHLEELGSFSAVFGRLVKLIRKFLDGF